MVSVIMVPIAEYLLNNVWLTASWAISNFDKLQHGMVLKIGAGLDSQESVKSGQFRASWTEASPF